MPCVGEDLKATIIFTLSQANHATRTLENVKFAQSYNSERENVD